MLRKSQKFQININVHLGAISLGQNYVDYKFALETTNLETFVSRRLKLCKKFAVRTSRNPNPSEWFIRSEPEPNTRSDKPEYKIPLCRLSRTRKGPHTLPNKHT